MASAGTPALSVLGLILQEASPDLFTWWWQGWKGRVESSGTLEAWTQMTHHQFRHILLVKASRKATLYSRSVCVDSTLWWEVLQVSRCKRHDYSVGRNTGNIFVIIVSYSIPSAVTTTLILFFILTGLFTVSGQVCIAYIHIVSP